jgi:uncharacterized membrane protein YkvA (DUF1232 family)
VRWWRSRWAPWTGRRGGGPSTRCSRTSTSTCSAARPAVEKATFPAKVLAYIRDPTVSVWRKASGLVAALYIIWPLDLIPDVPILGWLDDLGVLSIWAGFMLREIYRHAARQSDTAPPAK